MLIEFKNDPVPARRTVGGKGRTKSDLSIAVERMEAGQCFYVPYTRKEYNKVAATATRTAKALDRKFTVRKLHKDQENIIGVWRIA